MLSSPKRAAPFHEYLGTFDRGQKCTQLSRVRAPTTGAVEVFAELKMQSPVSSRPLNATSIFINVERSLIPPSPSKARWWGSEKGIAHGESRVRVS